MDMPIHSFGSMALVLCGCVLWMGRVQLSVQPQTPVALYIKLLLMLCCLAVLHVHCCSWLLIILGAV